jgi:Icc-related predicted phosphoesterase
LENAMHSLTMDRIVVLLHYAPIEGTLVGEPPEIWPFLGSTRLVETIDRFRSKVKAVFHGHAHRGTYYAETLAGIPVFNVAMPLEKPGGKSYGLTTV